MGTNDSMGATNGSECRQFSVQGPTFQLLLTYYYPVMLLLGVTGNLANVLVYSDAFLRSSPTVRLLSVKAVANLVHVLSLIPAFLYHSVFSGYHIAFLRAGAHR